MEQDDYDNSQDIKISIKSSKPNKKFWYDNDSDITIDGVENFIHDNTLWINRNFCKNIILSTEETIKKIVFNEMSVFNNNLDSLPVNLEYLEFFQYCVFSQPIDNLPSRLKTLILSESFNHPIDMLPNSLIKLVLSNLFNHLIDNLPSSLKILVLGDDFNHPINNLPIGLNKLVIGTSFAKSNIIFPPCLKYLEFNNNLNWIGDLSKLPNTLEFLILDANSFNYTNISSTLNKLPKSIKYLEIITEQNLEINIDYTNCLITKEIDAHIENYKRYKIIFL